MLHKFLFVIIFTFVAMLCSAQSQKGEVVNASVGFGLNAPNEDIDSSAS
jgi:hypothetical protein